MNHILNHILPLFPFQARRIMFGMRSCCIFLLLSYLSLSFAMILSFCALLPFPLTGLQLLWLTVIILPLLSVSLVGTPADSDLMNRMTGKRLDKMKVSYNFVCQILLEFNPTIRT